MQEEYGALNMIILHSNWILNKADSGEPFDC